jgi:hypothetical protein
MEVRVDRDVLELRIEGGIYRFLRGADGRWVLRWSDRWEDAERVLVGRGLATREWLGPETYGAVRLVLAENPLTKPTRGDIV